MLIESSAVEANITSDISRNVSGLPVSLLCGVFMTLGIRVELDLAYT